MSELRKYPRTRHILGSRLQSGDEDVGSAAFAEIAGRHLVVEEKVDGANAAISFASDGRVLLQSRGHYLTGGPRERHFDLLKRWANSVADAIRLVLKDRFIVYGEWLYAKHTIFYDALPHYFLEFDVFDRRRETFLSSAARRRLLGGLPFRSVPVLHEGAIADTTSLTRLLGRSAFKSPDWRAHLAGTARALEQNLPLVAQQTDDSDLMEGLYIKVEENDRVIDRFKFVRPDFLTAVLDSESHWQSRPILPNLLAPGVTIA
ncbi:MAG TPA: RNA ligase family protein [Xanthobacteraceae bacterium]|jgi:hypothetical protein